MDGIPMSIWDQNSDFQTWIGVYGVPLTHHTLRPNLKHENIDEFVSFKGHSRNLFFHQQKHTKPQDLPCYKPRPVTTKTYIIYPPITTTRSHIYKTHQKEHTHTYRPFWETFHTADFTEALDFWQTRGNQQKKHRRRWSNHCNDQSTGARCFFVPPWQIRPQNGVINHNGCSLNKALLRLLFLMGVPYMGVGWLAMTLLLILKRTAKAPELIADLED